MTIQRALKAVLLGAFGVFGVLSLPAFAITQPCDPGPNVPSSFVYLPILGGGQTYCQSTFGWSDTWFATSQPATYNQHLDVLSGDNAPSVFFTVGEVKMGTGNPQNLISPFLDAAAPGSVIAQPVPGGNPGVAVVSQLSVLGNVGTSTVVIDGILGIHITTTVTADGLTEAFTFTNLSDFTITNLSFDDFFRFHANGSLPGDLPCPTTTVAGGIVNTIGGTGGGCSPIVHNGLMFGSLDGGATVLAPSMWDLGIANTVFNDIGGGSYNNLGGPCQGDCAADLLWNLGTLGSGGTETLTVVKERAPEPESLALVGLALVALQLFRRRARMTA